MSDLKIRVGEPMPDFELPNQEGRSVRLSSFKGAPVALFVYPKADTPGWTKQACSFKDAIASFAKSGVTVLGLSNDPPPENAAFRTKYEFPFDLLCDVDHRVTEDLGLYGEQEFKGKKFQGLARATLLIDEEGKLKSVIRGIAPQDHATRTLENLP